MDVIFSKSNSNVTVICQIDNSCQMGNLLPRKNIVKKMPEARGGEAQRSLLPSAS